MEEHMRKVLFILLSFTMACLPLFAGGRNQGGAASGPVDYGQRTTGPNYWMVKYDQPVTIHVVNYERTVTPFPPGEDATKNAWTRGLKQYLNIDIVTDWVSTAQGYDEKLNLAIAAGELPDVFRASPMQFQQLVSAGLAADLTDYIPNNISDFVKKIMEVSPVVTESAKINGRLMAIPTYGYGDLWEVDDLWIRNDWMEQSRLSPPKTIADLENIMKTFMTQHPGSYGIPLVKNLYEVWHLAAAFNAAPNIWVDGPDGSIVYGTIQPAMKPLLACFADWYKKGYLRQDFMSQDAEARIADVTAGKVGIVLEENHAGWDGYTDLVKNTDSKAWLEPYEIPTIDGKPGIFPIPFGNGSYTVVNKNCKNIAAVLKSVSFVNWIACEARLQGALTEEEEFGYLLGGEGRHTMTALELADPYGNGSALVEWAREVGLNNGVIKTPPLLSEWQAQFGQAKPWFERRDPVGYARWIQQYAPRNSASINLNIINEGRYIADRLTGPMPEDAASYGSTLDEMLIEGFTRIIIGEQPLSYFDTIVAQWKASGGDIITSAVNRVYGKK
jgi:putative aldouronate transport system substrate-binding protein